MTIGGFLRGTLRRPLLWALLLLVSAGLAACESPDQKGLLSGLFKPRQQQRDTTTLTEQALGKLSKGEFLQAGEMFDNALRRNPRDVYALAGRGLVFMHAGQPAQARSAFEAVLALRPDPSMQMVVTGSPQPRPVADIASVNLALLQSGGVATGMAGAPASAPTPGATVDRVPPMQSTLMAQQPPPQAMMRPQMASATPGETKPMNGLTPALSNIASRFEILARLRDEGLVTPAEYAARRRANIGALLPLTQPPAAAGLDRPVPSADQISQRLHAIGRALEMRAITVEQHSAERSMIVDGLLPAKPMHKTNRPAPPTGLMEAAADVGQLEQLKARGLITSDEYAKERAAIEAGMQPKAPASAQAAAPTATAAKAPAKTNGGPRPGVHLASFRTEKAANRAWPQLRRAHSQLLANLRPEVTRIDLGPGKGVFYRLKAGPLPDQAAVKRLCQRLKARRQYCEPAFVGG